MLCIVVALWSSSASNALATLAGSRDFNGPDKVWQPLSSEVPLRVLAHESVAGGARDNAGCEHIVLAAPAGLSAQLACIIQPVAVLDELEARIWVKATQPGVQLAARITLPRSVSVRSQSAVTTIVRGQQYDRVGRWQQLVLSDVPKRLAEQVRVLRTEPGASVDPREAYVDAIVLLVPGGSDAIEVWTDDLDFDGIVLDERSGVLPAAFTSSTTLPQTPTVRLQGGRLQVDGRAFLPRVIEWHGEPLQFLTDRGFNTIQLTSLPTAEQADEARRLSLWFLCPPPGPEELSRTGFVAASDRIVAWLVNDDTEGTDPNYLRRWADLVRQTDPMSGRPVVVMPESDWELAGKAADILVARHPLASRMTNADCRQWFSSRRQYVEPGTSMWVSLPTQFHVVVGEQCAALSGHTAPPPNVDDRLLEALVHLVASECTSGFVFSSHSSLADKNPATRRRAALLELLNQQLQLIEPWLAGGKIVGRVQSSDEARSAALLHVDYTRLLMPIPSATDRTSAQAVPVDLLAGKAFVVPGVLESSQVFHLSPVELRSVPAQRVTGGMRTVWESDDDGLLILTEDPQVISSLRQRTTQNAVRVARLERDLAAEQATAVADTARQLAPLGVAAAETTRVIASVNAQIRQADALVVAGRVVESYRLARSLRSSL
ncbi:MAG: hypothetical protein WD468_02010, partial [Pirellulales bacterium]